MLVAAFAIGCGDQSKPKQEAAEPPTGPPDAKVTEPSTRPPDAKVTTEGWESPSDLGIVAATAGGFFDEVGRNPWVAVPAQPNRPVRYVSDGTDTFGVAQLPQVAIAKERGAPIVAIGSLLSQPTAALIWLKRSKLHTLGDLKGKTIGIPGLRYQKRFLASALANAGLSLEDVRVEALGYNLMPALLSGRIDASFGGSWNLEGVTLEERGASPVIRRVQSLGSPSYEELVVIARRDLLAKRPALVRDFMTAVHRATAAALDDPEAAAQFMTGADEPDSRDNPKVTEAQLEATLPLVSKTGRMDRGKASALIRWMHEEGMLERQIPVSRLLTNDYLPPPP